MCYINNIVKNDDVGKNKFQFFSKHHLTFERLRLYYSCNQFRLHGGSNKQQH
jgi:hypothetical protein